ncbi:hypothetical protein J31TS4_04870 [Paenibacillus sp. J31TS4]|uniref:cyclodeaminase/cyclohydrolase family protein n=1 Tax=Paenibacillus sp. J31TS4 TaxID=2807195 RepID=UPI001B1CB6F4|nr:cyclodeaminase/cyclohydrolase family protein [Paenibacillus sp. J31TS4]GIP37207.1 hypothetical protein J31TS4_04870 [Paenibacillus sp. J31TS4]
MTNRLFDEPIGSFLERAASKAATPGGGAAAALAAALGASMGEMAAAVTSAGTGDGGPSSTVAEAAARLHAARLAAEELAEADMAAFGSWMAAYRLPKGTEEEKAARTRSMVEATDGAIEVPLRLLRLCVSGLHAAGELADATKLRVLSDLGISAVFLASAARAAELTVRMNLGDVRDPGKRERARDEAHTLLAEADRLQEAVLTAVERRMETEHK